MSVGAPLPHDSAELHVTGRARYVDDIPCPAGTLHLAFGLSTEASAVIEEMDLTAVRQSPGVVAVLTAADMPFANDASPAPLPEPVLAEGEVHYIGQPMFLVVAESHRAARIAARKGRIRYAPRTPILTLDAALATNSRFEGGPVVWSRGEVAPALARATHLAEGTVEIGGQEHFYLEGQAALALPEDVGVTIRCSSQHPTEVQHKVAEALGLHMHDVRVEMRRMGGGFGGKESQGNHLAIACAVAARLTGRACKMRYDRDDDMVITGKRHDFRIHYRISADAEGKLLGAEFIQLARCGWSPDLSLPVCDRAMLHADNAYFIPALRVESHRLRTNTQSNTAYRGFGGPQGMLGVERAMEHLAHVIGIEPAELRRRNFYDEAAPLSPAGGPSAPPSPPESSSARKKQTTHYGQEVEDFILHGLLAELEKSSDYAARKAEIAVWNSQNRTLKRGIALSPVKFGISFTLTHLNQAGALVHVYSDGSVLLNHGGTEMGQGLHRKVCQVAARVFGIDSDAVRITASDTAKVPNTSATAASSGADMNGMAVQAACETVRERLAGFVAAREGCALGEVVFAEGRVAVPGKDWSFAEVALAAYGARVSLSSTGFYATPKISWDRVAGRGRPFYYFAYGAAVTEVVIDTLTGENRILRADIVHDAGSSLNPALDIGQVEGAYVQGAGWLTTEELVWNAKGQLTTHAPSTYKIPACSDRPRVFNVRLWDAPNREETVFRSKAVGEPPFMLGISAFLALNAACAACGPAWPDLQAPATAEAVLAAVARARGVAA
ncbi:xanthine dehydrogenase molybdopterin binding subunit [Sinirhodobacter ferrireducens]|uniref:Xanthine dehydrogenase molybdopterin binding subunit n=1 Tax=Paenirhodobacter ferrireducens TaxID=1215032 RepID=A0A443L949_9RHOB|nr:xanthine dehydrogenase molybdopterin binding subunit [Sinirhodobacter ferrireducens]RWR45684.1 xanthine dehydrogenase molybdopterin binding subunit [Sinirhodobacter ferrireducens]